MEAVSIKVLTSSKDGASLIKPSPLRVSLNRGYLLDPYSFYLITRSCPMSLTLETLAIFLQSQTLDGGGFPPPYEQRLSDFFGQFFLYHP